MSHAARHASHVARRASRDIRSASVGTATNQRNCNGNGEWYRDALHRTRSSRLRCAGRAPRRARRPVRDDADPDGARCSDDHAVAVVHVDREVARRRLALEGMETCEVLGRVPLID